MSDVSASNSPATGPWWVPEPGALSAPLPAKLGELLNLEASAKLLFTFKLSFFNFSSPANNRHLFPFETAAIAAGPSIASTARFHGGAMASGWFGSKAIELVRARSLFVNVSPAPTNLAERRAVLHALKKHGQIEVFKKLPVS